MIRSIWVALVWLTSVGLGVADTPTDRVRALLDKGDIAALEQEFVRLAAMAAESRNADALRNIHSRLFDTSHPKRIAVVEQWHQEMPNSLFALSAATWIAINRVELFGHVYQPYESPDNVPRARRQQWSESRNQAHAMADEAFAQANGYVPALDAWLLTRRFKLRQAATFVEAFTALMLAAPDRASMLRIVDTSYTGSPNDSQEVLRACLTFAETAVDYSTDACMIEASLKYSLRHDLRQVAEEVARESDDPMFADERMRIMLKQQDLDQTAKAQLVELHRNLPFDEANPTEYMYEGYRVSRATGLPEYRVEVTAKTLEHIAAILADDPFNHVLLWEKAKIHFQAFYATKDRAELIPARAAWEGAIVYGNFNPQLWHLGTYLAEADPGPEEFAALQVYFENAIANTLRSPLYVLYYFHFMQTARDAAENQIADQGDASGDAAALLERLKCPQLKAARAAAALCRATMGTISVCNPTLTHYEHVPQVLAEGAAGSCPVIADLPLSDLQYSATPLEAINLPWPTSRVAQD